MVIILFTVSITPAVAGVTMPNERICLPLYVDGGVGLFSSFLHALKHKVITHIINVKSLIFFIAINLEFKKVEFYDATKLCATREEFLPQIRDF